jgi:hypothetical protein
MCIGNLVLNHTGDEAQPYSDSMNVNQGFSPAQEVAQVWAGRSPARNVQHSPEIGPGPGSHESSTLPRAEDFLMSPEYALQDFNMWNVTYDPAWTSWSVGSDFDLDAMNASIAETIDPQHGFLYVSDTEQITRTEKGPSSVSKAVVSQSMIESVERGWCSYSRPESDVTPGTLTPVIEVENNDRQDVDETYRYNLASRLQHRPCKPIPHHWFKTSTISPFTPPIFTIW